MPTTGTPRKSFRLRPEVAARLARLSAEGRRNETQTIELALEALEAGPPPAAGRTTITMVPVPGRPGAWVPATPADMAAIFDLQEGRPGDRSDPEGWIPGIIGRAAGRGIAVLFRPGPANS